MKLQQLAGIALVTMATIAVAEPMKQLDAYKGNVGIGGCDVKETGSGKQFKAGIDITNEFDGQTYVERYYEIANADHPNAWKSIFIMSYDAQAKRWVRNGVDNSGERNAASSSGWNGDTWVWENDGVAIPIVKQGGNAFTFAVDVKDSGKLKRVAEGLCKRS
jgi:hypothetical protein